MSKDMVKNNTGKGGSKLSLLYKLALPIYIVYVLVFELFADYGASDIWSRAKKIFKKGKKKLGSKSKFIKLKLRDFK